MPDTTSQASTPFHAASAGANGAPKAVLSPSPAAEHALTQPEDTDAEAPLTAELSGGKVEIGGESGRAPSAVVRKPSMLDRIEAFISRLSTRNNFWHRVCSLIWLPFAFRSGIKMKKQDDRTFLAVLPFRRFNRNWYNAMAGAALLGNAEIAGGMYVFGACGGDYTVVCKHLEYKFLRPCFGPAVYRLSPRGDLAALMASGGEFNILVDMDVYQGLAKPKLAGGEGAGKEKRVGRCTATFHVTPKVHHKTKRERTVPEAPAATGQ